MFNTVYKFDINQHKASFLQAKKNQRFQLMDTSNVRYINPTDKNKIENPSTTIR